MSTNQGKGHTFGDEFSDFHKKAKVLVAEHGISKVVGKRDLGTVTEIIEMGLAVRAVEAQSSNPKVVTDLWDFYKMITEVQARRLGGTCTVVIPRAAASGGPQPA